jgi:uncharacterized protein YciI
VHPARPGFLAEPTPAEEASVGAHFDYLVRLAREGVVLLAGRTLNEDPTTFGIVIFEADDADAARGIMRDDPAVRDGVFAAELFPYRIAVASPRLCAPAAL